MIAHLDDFCQNGFMRSLTFMCQALANSVDSELIAPLSYAGTSG